MSAAGFLQRLMDDERFSRDIAHTETLPPRSARFGDIQPPLPAWIEERLRQEGVRRLYSHQWEALRLAREGKNVVTVTPTASGKTLVYTLPILEALEKDPEAHALMLFPLKALAQDQLKRLQAFDRSTGNEPALAAIYDGDTPQAMREKLKANPARILLTNPDMLHYGFLAFHAQWERFFRSLKYVVVDELHTYRGVFGSHVLQILRRLRRITEFYRTRPVFLATSATIANPAELAEELTGTPFELVEENGAPASRRHMVFVNPVGNIYTSAVRLFVEAVESGLKTIVFTKSRKMTELIHQWVAQSSPDLATKISAYRAGYLANERREIELGLRSGDLKGVIATSALEMGIDIGGLDVCILVGYPGTITNTWQRAGRVGRGTNESIVFLLAQQDALDQYFMHHPSDFFGRSAEAAVVDAANPYLLKSHLACAAMEMPLRKDDTIYHSDKLKPVIDELVAGGVLLEAARGAAWFASRKRPHREIDIRGAGPTFTIFDSRTRKAIGKVSGLQAMTECHPGAVYLHHGLSYLISKLDMNKEEVWASKKRVDFYTLAKTEKETEIISVFESRDVWADGEGVEEEGDEKPLRYRVSLGTVKVTEQVVGYEIRNTQGRDKVDDKPLDLPPVTYETVGLWIEPASLVTAGLAMDKRHVMGSLHATEHASLALLPLFALCDRNDVGGISFTHHPELKGPAIFLYDGHPGGVGLATKAYHVLDDLLEKVKALVSDCSCEDGCPSCIHSPKCGHGNNPLDKQGCIRFLQHLTGEKVWLPKDVVDAPKPADPADQAAPSSKLRTGGQAMQRRKQPKAVPYKSQVELLKDRDIVVFDLETQRSAQEVGGWHNAHLMRISLAVIYEMKTQTFKTYFEEDVLDLIDRLFQAELVVGFNQKKFDYSVLQAYTGQDMRALPSLDLLDAFYLHHGYRAGLGALAQATLGAPKSADGLQALQWWKEGKLEEIETYCRMDVELTWKLLFHILDKGFVFLEKKPHGKARVPLPIDFARFLPR